MSGCDLRQHRTIPRAQAPKTVPLTHAPKCIPDPDRGQGAQPQKKRVEGTQYPPNDSPLPRLRNVINLRGAKDGSPCRYGAPAQSPPPSGNVVNLIGGKGRQPQKTAAGGSGDRGRSPRFNPPSLWEGGRGVGNLCTTFLKLMTLPVYGGGGWGWGQLRGNSPKEHSTIPPLIPRKATFSIPHK